MGPCIPRVSYNYQTRTQQLPVPIPRKPKRKGKSVLGFEKFKGGRKKACKATFQKKIVVFQYIGSVNEFSRSEKLIIVRGLLPPISLDANQDEIRQEVCAVINDNPSLSEVTPSDFEFVSVSGKQVSIPQCKKGFDWDGRAVKELAGSGCVYVRLTREFDAEKGKEIVDISSESSDIEIGPNPTETPSMTNVVPLYSSTDGCCSYTYRQTSSTLASGTRINNMLSLQCPLPLNASK